LWSKYGKPDPSMMVNGMLAGLVAITAPCAFVSSFWAFIIGAISGVLVCWAAIFNRDGHADRRSGRAHSPSTASTAPGVC